MKNQHPLGFAIIFLAFQFLSPMYISIFSKAQLMGNNAIMWYAISSGIMACILAAVYSKRERKLEEIRNAEHDAKLLNAGMKFQRRIYKEKL